MKRLFSFIFAALFAVSMMATTVTFTKDDFAGQGTANTGSEVSATKNGVTFTYSKGYCADESLRCYAHGSLLITAEFTIAKINFTTTGGKTGGLDAEVEVNATSYNVDDLASQARFTEIVITDESGDEPTPGPTPDQEYAYQDTINFTTDIEDFNDWGTSYKKHVLDYENVKIVFDSANHQTSTITNMPVVYKGGSVFVLAKKSNTYFKAIKLICQQWGSKAQTISLQYSIDGGINYIDFDPAITSTNFEILNNELVLDINAMKFSFNASNQVGIKNLYFDLAEKSPATSLIETKDKAMAIKRFKDGQILIERNDGTYTVIGTRVK